MHLEHLGKLLPMIGVAVTRGLALPPLGRSDFSDATIS
jgi:hypothetical protein